MNRSYRRHLLWRSLTRTRYLLVVAAVIAVLLVALDTRPRDKNCTWYYGSSGRGLVGECVPRGKLPPPGFHKYASSITPVPRKPY